MIVFPTNLCYMILNKKKIKVISYEEMLEMASLGAKVMQPVSIQDARLNRINIEVKSSFIKKPGTLITKRTNLNNNKIITGISSTDNDAKVTLLGVKDRPGIAASIFRPLSKNSINVDMVVQNISVDGRQTDLTFTIKSNDLNKTKKINPKYSYIFGYGSLTHDEDRKETTLYHYPATPVIINKSFINTFIFLCFNL